jgi:hypothetical protein
MATSLNESFLASVFYFKPQTSLGDVANRMLDLQIATALPICFAFPIRFDQCGQL